MSSENIVEITRKRPGGTGIPVPVNRIRDGRKRKITDEKTRQIEDESKPKELIYKEGNNSPMKKKAKKDKIVARRHKRGRLKRMKRGNQDNPGKMEEEDMRITSRIGETSENKEISSEEENSGDLSEFGEEENCSSSATYYEESNEKSEKRKIRDRNLRRYKMVRTKNGLKYEEDLTEEERAQRGKQGEIYKHTHNGRSWKLPLPRRQKQVVRKQTK